MHSGHQLLQLPGLVEQILGERGRKNGQRGRHREVVAQYFPGFSLVLGVPLQLVFFVDEDKACIINFEKYL